MGLTRSRGALRLVSGPRQVMVRPSQRAGRPVKGYFAQRGWIVGTSPRVGRATITGPKGNRLTFTERAPFTNRPAFVAGRIVPDRGIIGGTKYQTKVYRNPTRSSLARFDRLINRVPGGGGAARRNVAYALSSPGGKQ